ncbi:hypothetical protein EDB81DRAFT_889694 [Dactylonectria macrodidyma]|uniref:Uncharacterized protein n=1 Tax=Dactylonectria macrodidyma TaxID=307937 RepID=A0A9P9DVY0_9HYPO|nr:hypothetical protein EDB81DRAFT_889694 [Dactylonectria macrodidyma]
MIGSLESPYPLKSASDIELQKLPQAPWKWKICESCHNGETCAQSTCSWRLSARLQTFFDFYKKITSSYLPELRRPSAPALSHHDLLDIVNLLRANPNMKRSDLTGEYFSAREKLRPISDQHRAINLVVRVMCMINCFAKNQPSGLLELGTQPVQWHSDKSFAEFISGAFPQTNMGNLRVRDNSGKIRDIKSAISARKLRKRIDATNGIVEIYYYTSVLRENLMASQALHSPHSFDHSISAGNIPRQIPLEALDSVRQILFPFDSESNQILRNLVSKESFDPDCLKYDSAIYRKEGEEEVTYSYFGTRLIQLFEELEDPSPRGLLGKWFQLKSGARYVMMATHIGVTIAIILGILGLAVGIF